MVSGSSSWAARPASALATAKTAARCGAEVTVISRQPASVDRALAKLPPGAGGWCARPAARTDMAALDLEKAREFFALRYFGALGAVHAAAPHLRPGGSITLTTGS